MVKKGASMADTTAYEHIAVCIRPFGRVDRFLERSRALRAATGSGRLSIVMSLPAASCTPVRRLVGSDPEDIASAAREWLDRAASDVPEGDAVLLDGYPPAAVCEWAQASAVKPARCRIAPRACGAGLLGSFAGYLVRNAPCSVLLTRPDAG